MSLARVSYTQTVSGNKSFTVPFEYISRDYVKVTVDGVNTSYNWLNDSMISFNVAPVTGALIEIVRITDREELLVKYNDASTITSNQLNLTATQTFHMAQEADDLAVESNGLARQATEDSQEAISIAEGAVVTANNADTKADQAVLTANEASTTADEATSTADMALTNASQAVITANEANVTANEANVTAGNAVSTANEAVLTANQADAKADEAVLTSDEADAKADEAVIIADLADTKADQAILTSGEALDIANTASLAASQAEFSAANANAQATQAATDAESAAAIASGLETTVNQVLDDVEAIAGGDLTDFSRNSDNLSELSDVEVAKFNLGLELVDNTSDADKPVSTATQTALASKVDTQFFETTVEGLESSIAGKANTSHTHQINEVVGLRGELDEAKTLPKTNLGSTASSSQVILTSSTGNDTIIEGATQFNAGVMTNTDKTKLDGIQAGAQVNIPTNLSGFRDDAQFRIDNDNGTGVILPTATPLYRGIMSSEDKERLETGNLSNNKVLTNRGTLTGNPNQNLANGAWRVETQSQIHPTTHYGTLLHLDQGSDTKAQFLIGFNGAGAFVRGGYDNGATWSDWRSIQAPFYEQIWSGSASNDQTIWTSKPISDFSQLIVWGYVTRNSAPWRNTGTALVNVWSSGTMLPIHSGGNGLGGVMRGNEPNQLVVKNFTGDSAFRVELVFGVKIYQ